MKENRILEGIKTIAEGSSTIEGWALTIIAGSILLIVGSSYLRPLNKKTRLIYLLFIPGWFFLGWSIYYGNLISRSFMAAVLAPKPDRVIEIGGEINILFSAQLMKFNIGLFIFSIWLIIFLVWWIFGNWTTSKREP